MQIVIDINDNKYQWIKDNPLTYDNEYPEAYKKKLSYLRGQDTKEAMRKARGEG